MITVGWRELVGLPELGLKRLPAKIDSGARTSSLHGIVLDEFRRDGEKFVRFEVFFPGDKVKQVCEAVHVDVLSLIHI
mgnify:FL=1